MTDGVDDDILSLKQITGSLSNVESCRGVKSCLSMTVLKVDIDLRPCQQELPHLLLIISKTNQIKTKLTNYLQQILT